MQELGSDPRRAEDACSRRRAVAPILLLSLYAAALALVWGACASTDVTPEPGVPSSQRDYLLDPVEGYAGTLGESVLSRIEAAYQGLLETGDPKVAQVAADSLLSLDPQLVPARVLAAQGELVARRYGDAVATLAGRLDDSYTAGLLVLGRAAELDGLIPIAFDAYRRAAGSSAVAERRANALRGRALEAVRGEIDDSLERGRFEEAAGKVELLESWEPGARETLDAQRRLAFATGDRAGELEALRQLARLDDTAETLERLGQLELEVGDARRGLEVFEELSRRNPRDPRLQELLAQAKFLWRLEMVPPEVQELVQRSELSRGDFATLLYWLVPNVRSGSSSEPRIATDILDHPQRDAIVRVLNLGILEVEDPTLHRFAPDQPVSRREALEGLLRIPLEFGEDVPCVRDLGLVSQATTSFVCQTAARCGLLPSSEDCLPAATLGGREALDLVRRTLVVLGEG